MTSGATFDDGFLRPEELAELRATLFDQGRDALDALHHEVLALEGLAPTPERLRALRRAAHTLKSDCASVGFGDLSSLSHALEDTLGALEGGNPVSAAQGDVLLLAVDVLRAGLEAGARDEPGPDVAPVLARLRGLVAAPVAPLVWDAQIQARLDAGRATGLTPVRLDVAFESDVRRRARRVTALLRTLQAEPLARAPHTGLERAARVQVLALSPLAFEELTERAAGFGGAHVELHVPTSSESPPQPPDVAAAVPVRGAARVPGRIDEGPREGETVRVEARRVDEVLNLVGEMVTARATLQSVAAEIEPSLPQELSVRLNEAQSLLARVLQDLQRSAMRMRMAPAERVFRRFTRPVRDLARASGKRVRLHVEGQATELDRGLLDALEDPLLHLVRNALDHGLETPEERAAHGKPGEGTLTLRASREGNQVVIEVADDGRGVDPDAVLARAVEHGLLTAEEGQALGEHERLQLVFRPGLSTARAVTETSGRGVGLDVVRATVEALRGAVHARNLPGGGAAFVIRVPLTVAILRALLFRVGAQTLALPLSSVLEIARAADLLVQRLGGRSIFRLRDGTLGLVELCELLREPPGPPGAGFVLVLRGAAGPFGVRVDELLGEQELVIKAVQDRFIRAPLVAGAAVLGGGIVVLILDALALQRAAQTHAERADD